MGSSPSLRCYALLNSTVQKHSIFHIAYDWTIQHAGAANNRLCRLEGTRAITLTITR